MLIGPLSHVEALELDWQPDMVEHQRAAQSRGIITTASYSQVTEPLYRRAVGRWQNYAEPLAPVGLAGGRRGARWWFVRVWAVRRRMGISREA